MKIALIVTLFALFVLPVVAQEAPKVDPAKVEAAKPPALTPVQLNVLKTSEKLVLEKKAALEATPDFKKLQELNVKLGKSKEFLDYQATLQQFNAIKAMLGVK